MVDERDQVRRILDTLRGTSRPLSITAISRQSGLDRHTASHILEILYVRGEILCLHQGMAKKYYLKEGSPRTLLSPASADLIIIVDQKWDLLYVNETAAEWMATPAKDLAGKKLDSLIHPVLHHPEFLSHLQEIRSQKVVRVTLTISREKGNLSYPVTITHIGFPDKNSGIIIIIENAFIDDGSQMPLRSGIIEQLSPGLVVADLQGEILHVNPSFLMSVRYPNESDILGRTITDILGGDPNLIETLINNGTYFSQFHDMILKRRDGSQVFCMMRWELVKSLSGIPFYISGIMLDMSGWGELKEKIVTLEERFRDIVERTSDVIWETGVDLCYTYVSPAITKMTGYLPGELTGTPSLWLLSYQGNGDETKKSFSKTSAAGSFITREHPLEHKDGHRVIVETRAIPLFSPAGKFRGYRGIDRDITERKRSEKALRESEEKYRFIADNTADNIWIFDMDFHLQYISPSVSKMKGFTVEESLAQSLDKMMTTESLASVMKRFEKEMALEATGTADPERTVFFETEEYCKDGSTVLVENSVNLLRDIQGHPVGMLGVSRDITERKRSEKAFRDSEEKYRTLAEHVHDGIYIFKEDRLLYANTRVSEISGYSSEELLAMPFTDHIHPDDLAFIKDIIKRRLQGESVPDFFECRIFRKDGMVMDIEFAVTTITYLGGLAALGVIRDITDRKRMNEEFRQSELLLREIFNNANDAIFLLERTTAGPGKYLLVNDKAVRMLGYSKEELMEMSPRDIVPVDIQKKIMPEVVKKLLKDGYVTFESVHRRKDGSVYPVEVSIHTFLYKGTDVDLSIIRDITDRKQAEEALRESEEKFRLLINGSNDVFGILDPAGKIQYMSEPVVNSTGFQASEYEGRAALEFIHPDDRKETGAALEQVIGDHKKSLRIEFRVSRKDGGWVWVETLGTNHISHPAIHGIVLNIRNITERKKVEEALRESEEKYHLIFQSDPEALFLTEMGGKGTVIDTNKAGLRMYGYSLDEVRRMRILDFSNEPEKTKASAVLPIGSVVAIPLRWHRKKDGTVFPVEISGCVFEMNGRGVILAIHRDITERKRAEEAIKSSLAEKEVLLREIHHRVRNNLAGIISLIDLHISSLTEPAQIYLLKDLETRIRSMALIHESLYGAQDLARVNVTTYTENLTRHLVTMFETATVVRCRIDMGNIILPIDTATPCGLVMNEIVTNSLKYAFPGTFSCEEIRGEPCTITVALHREGSDYLLTVADNGIGIPAGIDRDKTPSLGLFLIKFIVKHQLQGTLEVNTDNGTSYTIRFPEPETKERTTDEKR